MNDVKLIGRVFQDSFYNNLFLLKAIPEDVLRYFSKDIACCSDTKEQYQIIFHGLNLLVCLLAPEL